MEHPVLYTHCTTLMRAGWLGGVVVKGVGLVIERSQVRLPAGAVPGSLGQLSLPSLRGGKSSTNLLAGVKEWRVHLCRVAVNTGTLRDPIWQLTPRSSMKSSR